MECNLLRAQVAAAATNFEPEPGEKGGLRHFPFLACSSLMNVQCACMRYRHISIKALKSSLWLLLIWPLIKVYTSNKILLKRQEN